MTKAHPIEWAFALFVVPPGNRAICQHLDNQIDKK